MDIKEILKQKIIDYIANVKNICYNIIANAFKL